MIQFTARHYHNTPEVDACPHCYQRDGLIYSKHLKFPISCEACRLKIKNKDKPKNYGPVSQSLIDRGQALYEEELKRKLGVK